jgi:hypothetical protein
MEESMQSAQRVCFPNGSLNRVLFFWAKKKKKKKKKKLDGRVVPEWGGHSGLGLTESRFSINKEKDDYMV